jgi:hypothetical protein
MNEMNNERLMAAIRCLSEMEKMPPRLVLRFHISAGNIRRDDPWVDAAMSCAKPEDILSVALWFFATDIKSGLYDGVAEQVTS